MDGRTLPITLNPDIMNTYRVRLKGHMPVTVQAEDAQSAAREVARRDVMKHIKEGVIVHPKELYVWNEQGMCILACAAHTLKVEETEEATQLYYTAISRAMRAMRAMRNLNTA